MSLVGSAFGKSHHLRGNSIQPKHGVLWQPCTPFQRPSREALDLQVLLALAHHTEHCFGQKGQVHHDPERSVRSNTVARYVTRMPAKDTGKIAGTSGQNSTSSRPKTAAMEKRRPVNLSDRALKENVWAIPRRSRMLTFPLGFLCCATVRCVGKALDIEISTRRKVRNGIV